VWRDFVKLFLATFGVGVAVLYAFILVVDPFDTGRFGIDWGMGVVDDNARTAAASRGRDRRFDSAVIGNSRAELLDPNRLSAASGRRFVQLSVLGSGPRQQLALLDWFFRHHARVGAIVLVTDVNWCSENPRMPTNFPFPFWLYAESSFEYALHALRTSALEHGLRRVLLALGLRQASDPSGSQGQERGTVRRFSSIIPEDYHPADDIREPRRSFPAIERLHAFLAERANDVSIIAVFPPAFVTLLPAAGSRDGIWTAECKGALTRLVRDRGAFIDVAVDGGLVRDPGNFTDGIHYRAGVARAIEARIIAALPPR
jgi:hypothetical protein